MFDRHPRVGIVAVKLLLFDQRDRFHAAGDIYRVDGIPGNRVTGAEQAFRAGQSEYEIHLSYLRGADHTEVELERLGSERNLEKKRLTQP